jgi:hypothetical protein
VFGTYLSSAFDVLGVAADEGGLLLVGGGHYCGFGLVNLGGWW